MSHVSQSALSVERHLMPEGVVLLQLGGIIDAKTFEQLEGAVQDVLTRGGNRLIVDLSGIGYISSAGIGVLLYAMGETRRAKGDLVLVGLQPTVLEVFDSLHLISLFILKQDVTEAALVFRKP